MLTAFSSIDTFTITIFLELCSCEVKTCPYVVLSWTRKNIVNLKGEDSYYCYYYYCSR